VISNGQRLSRFLGLLGILGVVLFGLNIDWGKEDLSSGVLLAGADTSALQASEVIILCQFGVGATDNIGKYDVTPLRLGWYVNWTASADPPRPDGTEYVATIRLSQVGTDSYSYSPSGSQLKQVIENNPGAVWLIGNEPDRPGPWQDDCLPEIYAQAYHELYYLIKREDPSAKVFAGGIVQATEVRLQYLDLVLESYRDLYGASLPADGWNIHGFILHEMDCDYDPDDCWGAEVPSGVDVPYGEILPYDENDNFSLFKERVERFRRWMADRGYRGLPVYLSEFGVQMPPHLGFPPERVNAFMTKTFDYLLTAADPVLGDSTDGNRLVQRWAWWSLSESEETNGWLFDPDTYARSAMGDHWAGYVSEMTAAADLYPAHIYADPVAPFSSGENITFTLKAVVANQGNISSVQAVSVRFYEGDPTTGGVQIGEDKIVPPLPGCGGNDVVEVEWSNVSPGTYSVYVDVDVDQVVDELDETNNLRGETILVATHRVFLSMVSRWKQ